MVYLCLSWNLPDFWFQLIEDIKKKKNNNNNNNNNTDNMHIKMHIKNHSNTGIST